MNDVRVKCSECDAMILLQTAVKYGGLCPRCSDMPESLRKERRDFERDLTTGNLFTPTENELHSARTPSEFGAPERE